MLRHWLFLWTALTMTGVIGYIYDDSGHITGFGDGPDVTCAGGLFPIVLFGCDTGVPDVDCGNNNGCLASLLDKCYSQAHNLEGYRSCVLQVTTKCMVNGKLTLSQEGHVWGCASTVVAVAGK